MAILIDPPLWPAHGTTFAHLVSDTSLEELHAFAARADLPERAFDGDHYDIPAHRHADMVALGAQPVSGRELIQRLRASGLRIPARDRPEALRRALTLRWREVTNRIRQSEPQSGPLSQPQVESNESGPPDTAGVSSRQIAAQERIWGGWGPQIAPDLESATALQRQNEKRLLGQHGTGPLEQNDERLLGQNEEELPGQNEARLLGQHERRPLGQREERLLRQREERPPGQRVEAVGPDLLDRWSEPHRRYHDLRHLRDVLTALDVLTEASRSGSPSQTATHNDAASHGAPGTSGKPDEAAQREAPLAVVLAAWFHDAVYDGVPGEDEQASADLANTYLTAAGLPAPTVHEVVRLVLLTRTHSPDPDDEHGALLCDADLAVLARKEAGYHRYTRDVRAEYAHVPEPDFRKGRTAVVRHLLDADPLYHTARGRHLWQDRARANLRAELAALTRP